MRSFKFDRNVRFSFLLPYGYVSPQALMLSVPAADVAYAAYCDDITMERRETLCLQNYQKRLRMITAMAELGYIERNSRKCGKKEWENIKFYRLTQAGFYYLTNTPDDILEQERMANIPRLKNRNKNEISYLPQDPQFIANRQYLYEIANKANPSAEEQALFKRLILESVYNDNLGLLATEPALAKNVLVTSAHRPDAFYRGWKIMNIEAMFKANGYLSALDRKHFSTLVQRKKEEAGQMEIYDFCMQTLEKWYQANPDSYLYSTPLESYAEQIKDVWKTTPIFYPISEIDDAIIEIELDRPINEKKTTKSYRHLCLGVAVGRQKNYIVHHTRFGGTPWAELIERNTIGSVQQRLNKENEKAPILGAKRSITNALMFCASIPHFAALFTTAKQGTKEEIKRKYRIGAPYDSVCLVPICPSGSMQLRGLLESSPLDYERAITNFLLQFDGFAKRPLGPDMNDNIFTLSYNQKPVLVAHTMNWQKLAIAKELYDEGMKFYVSCYPEQAKYIRSIMPDVKFL